MGQQPQGMPPQAPLAPGVDPAMAGNPLAQEAGQQQAGGGDPNAMTDPNAQPPLEPTAQPESMSWYPGSNQSPIYPNGEGPITSQVPKVAQAAYNPGLLGQLLSDQTQNNVNGPITYNMSTGQKWSFDMLGDVSLRRAAEQSALKRKKEQNGLHTTVEEPGGTATDGSGTDGMSNDGGSGYEATCFSRELACHVGGGITAWNGEILSTWSTVVTSWSLRDI